MNEKDKKKGTNSKKEKVADREPVKDGEGCTGATARDAKGECQQKAYPKEGAVERKYTKQQLVSSARYRNNRDLFSAILEDGAMYAIAEVEQMAEQFMKGKVK